jgi:hypothetical protein
MKALTLWQPWATLVAIGAKEYETRSWSTTHRGELAIHSAKTKDHLGIARANPLFRDALMSAGYGSVNQLVRGAVLAVVEVVDCFPVEEVWHMLEEDEAAFGDYGAGRFAWELRVMRLYDQPVPARGSQGLWNWEER